MVQSQHFVISQKASPAMRGEFHVTFRMCPPIHHENANEFSILFSLSPLCPSQLMLRSSSRNFWLRSSHSGFWHDKKMNRIDTKAKTSLHAICSIQLHREMSASNVGIGSEIGFDKSFLLVKVCSKPRKRTVAKFRSRVTQNARFFSFSSPISFLPLPLGDETNYETPHGDFHRQSEAPDENPKSHICKLAVKLRPRPFSRFRSSLKKEWLGRDCSQGKENFDMGELARQSSCFPFVVLKTLHLCVCYWFYLKNVLANRILRLHFPKMITEMWKILISTEGKSSKHCRNIRFKRIKTPG